MLHQKQHLQNRVQRIDPIYHTPLSLTAFCLPQHGTCSPADAAGPAENHRPQIPQVQLGWGWPQRSDLLWQQLSRPSASEGQPPTTHTEAEVPLHWNYFHSPSPASPSNLGKQLPSPRGRVMGVGESWLSQSMFVPPARELCETLLIISETRDAKFRTDFIPILSMKLGTAQSHWKGLQRWKVVLKIIFLQNAHFSLPVFCHPAKTVLPQEICSIMNSSVPT